MERRQKLAAEQEEAERSSSVVSISSSNFESLIRKSKESWIIKFYAPWCGHCRRLVCLNQMMITLTHKSAGSNLESAESSAARTE